jgi:magnesium-transporting ATPase (P-type)
MLDAEAAMAGRGLRVLALAYRLLPSHWDELTAERDMVLVGIVGREDPPRPRVPGAVRRAREAGIRVIAVTGDHPNTSVATAGEIGLVASRNPTVIIGAESRRRSENELQLVSDARELVFARIGGDQKLRIVPALQKEGEIVAVTGDGVMMPPPSRKQTRKPTSGSPWDGPAPTWRGKPSTWFCSMTISRASSTPSNRAARRSITSASS